MKAHKYADIFPMLQQEQLQELADDIRENGLKQPIMTYQGQILDGRNRFAACRLAGVYPATVPAEVDTDEQALSLVLSLNLQRRHLNESQRAMVAARILPMYEEQAAARRAEEGRKAALRQQAEERGEPEERVWANLPRPSPPEPIRATEQAAQAVAVSRRSVQDAKKVVEQAQPEVVEAIERGKLAVSAAVEVTKMEPEEQREVARLVTSGEASSGAEAIREVRKPHVAHNSGENEWYTPPEFIEAARATMGGIDLDPASCEVANARVKAGRFFDMAADGLAQQWSGRVWMNPPYEKGLIDRFADKMAESVEDGAVQAACVLVNNATETKWFARMADAASAICFPTGRIRFLSPTGVKGAPLQGQAVLYFGRDVEAFAEAFGGFGFVAEVRRG